jgi:hypothetical protein
LRRGFFEFQLVREEMDIEAATLSKRVVGQDACMRP